MTGAASALYVVIAGGVAAELADRRRTLFGVAFAATLWPFFLGLALGAAIARDTER